MWLSLWKSTMSAQITLISYSWTSPVLKNAAFAVKICFVSVTRAYVITTNLKQVDIF